MTRRIHRPAFAATAVPERVDFLGLEFNALGFVVRIVAYDEPDERVFDIVFANAFAQRSMDEGKYLRTEISWVPDSENRGPIVVVEDSDFVSWFNEQCGIYTADEIIHIAILTMNEWVDVLCRVMPEVKLVGNYSDLYPADGVLKV